MKKLNLALAMATLLLLVSFQCAFAQLDATPEGKKLAGLVDRIAKVSTGTQSEAEYRAASKAYTDILSELEKIEPGNLSFDEEIDLELAIAHVKRQLFEMDDIELYKVSPVRYYALGSTNRLFVRPGAIGDPGVESAVRELKRLPTVLDNAKKNLTNPAKTWVENAIYQGYYAKLLLQDSVPNAIVRDPALKQELIAASKPALAAVNDYVAWLENDLLPRSNRSPAWKPEEVNFYQFEHEMLYDYSVDDMIRIAERENKKCKAEMQALAKRIHPSGDLRTVWEDMKDEAPPWEEVMPMAEKFVVMAADWLKSPAGNHLVTIPDFDYGVRLTSPMSRRTLSFGGATYGPTVAGRLSGYYVLTPLEDILTEEERASRIRSYNPYWTHVISYHEWLGHTVQRAAAGTREQRPMREIFRSIYHSQAWSFYLEKLLEDEGYFEILDHTTALKTRMGRLQMRMWRIQRILTKLKMAKGEMTFDEAVQAYIDEIGMEPTNSFIEVQRDSQSPSPPGREIIGELLIEEMREEYKQRMGEHYSMREFHDRFLSFGDLPFPIVRRLMFRE